MEVELKDINDMALNPQLTIAVDFIYLRSVHIHFSVHLS